MEKVSRLVFNVDEVKKAMLNTTPKEQRDILREHLHEALETVIIVETIRTLVSSDVGVSAEKLEDCQKLATFLDQTPRGETAQEVLGNLTQDLNLFLQITQFTDIYLQYFSKEGPVFNFQDWLLGEEAIPRKGENPVYPYSLETLGTGQYDVDANGVELSHDPVFIKEALIEIINYQARTKDGIYNPNNTPNLSAGWYQDEKIYVHPVLKDGYSWEY
jgi:hypothetical protein